MWLRNACPVALIALSVAALGGSALAACPNPANQTSFLRAEPLAAAPDGMVMVDVRVIRSPPPPYKADVAIEASVSKSHAGELTPGKRVRLAPEPKLGSCDIVPAMGDTGVLIGKLVRWDGVIAVVEPQRQKAGQ